MAIPIGELSFTSLFLIRIRSMPNFSSLLGDVTTDDVAVTSSWHRWRLSSSSSSSSATEFGREVITSTSSLLLPSGPAPDVCESTRIELTQSSFCTDKESTSGVTSESGSVDDVGGMAAEVQIGDEQWNGNRNIGDDWDRRPEVQTPNIATQPRFFSAVVDWLIVRRPNE